MDASSIRGKRVSIIGGARSGIAAARLLKEKGATLFLSENAAEEKVPEIAREQLNELGLGVEYGGHTDTVLEADLIVLSPGVPSEIPVVQRALARSIPVVSELEAASWFSRGRVIAVTGTNGKTTATTLTGRFFQEARMPYEVGGNIGTPYSALVERLDRNGTAILEISSFQLDHTDKFRPDIGILLNITPDHLDRYGNSFERYIASKCRIFRNQRKGDSIIYNRDDQVTRDAVEKNVGSDVTLLPFSIREHVTQGAFLRNDSVVLAIADAEEKIIRADEVGIRGEHNLQNAMAALLAAKLSGIPKAILKRTLVSFRGVEHRLEVVRELNGVVYINDSKATNVESVWYALRSFANPLILLLGGRDKGNDYARLKPLVSRNVRLIVAIGESADKIIREFSEITKVKSGTSMEEAVRIAAGSAADGDVVLLSPACASFDWFENYEHRGKTFKEIVLSLPE